MSSIALKIVLHGLIALVPTTEVGDNNDAANYMTALLVNGLTPHGIEKRCDSIHKPKLTLLSIEPGQCSDADCIVSGNQCNCGEAALAGKQISLEIHPNPETAAQRPNNEIPVNGLPLDPGEASNFSYVANLAQAPFRLVLNQAYLGDAPPAHLLTRIKVPFQTITACSLATREDGGQVNVHTMSFRKRNDPSMPNEPSQALAQMVVVKLDIPAASATGGEERKVTLRIRKFDEDDTKGHTIDLLPGASGYKIELSNQPDLPLDRDDPCNDTVARHFAMFYDLAENAPELDKRLLPHFSLTQWKSRASITPEICKNPFFGPMDRPACPIASFNP